MKDLEYVELYPRIDVYRNVLKDPQSLYQTMKKSERTSEGKYLLKTWDPWAHFGTYSQTKNPLEVQEDQKSDPMFIEEKDFVDQIQAAYDAVLLDYITRHNIELKPNWHFSGCSFSKYTDQVDVLDNKMTMQYHTDFIISERDMPGSKFQLTCTMYINDDYDGGEICFKINDHFISHKPSKGDVIVFPSTRPYLHGVRKNYNGERYMIRSFWQYKYEGSQEWLENEKKYGASVWEEMEKERLKKEMSSGQYNAELYREIFDRDNGKF